MAAGSHAGMQVAGCPARGVCEARSLARHHGTSAPRHARFGSWVVICNLFFVFKSSKGEQEASKKSKRAASSAQGARKQKRQKSEAKGSSS